MTSKKNDLEIIYNLQWKNKPANGGDKASIIGVYDIPATTLNWEVFKSYLLKNSGTAGDDVKVSYVTDNGKEYPIQSQTDFQVALYAFRRKARLGEMITLKLDRISDQPLHKNNRHSNDVETQFDDNEAQSLVSTCCGGDTPPEWFMNYMAQFKKDISEEITATVSSIVSSAVSNIKPQVVSQPSSYHSRKGKEPSKRHRKLQPFLGDVPSEGCRSKDLIKSLKLDSKLEKLERKATKYKEKKLAIYTVRSSDSEAGISTLKVKPQEVPDGEENGKMDASPVATQSIIPHMFGGEVYLHRWEVMNTGSLPWTSKTFLQFTWGSKALEPLERTISVPYLKPGDKGTVVVRLQIPEEPGQYESYWHFVHKGRRFGHWLGCQIIVDPFALKNNKSETSTSTPKTVKIVENVEEKSDSKKMVTHYSRILLPDDVDENPQEDFLFDARDFVQYNVEEVSQKQVEEIDAGNILDEVAQEVGAKVDDLHLQDPTDTNCSSDSDNQSIASVSVSSNSSKCSREFVVIPIPDCFTIEKQAEDEKKIISQPSECLCTTAHEGENCDDNNNTEDTHDAVPSTSAAKEEEEDMVFISVSGDNESGEDFACVLVDGQKVKIPKRILKSEFLEKVEKINVLWKNNESRSSSIASSVELVKKEEEEEVVNTREESEILTSTATSSATLEPTNDLSHCSATGSCFSDVNVPEKNSRLFIFPQKCPGFEVVASCSDTAAENVVALNAGKTCQNTFTPPLNLSTHDRNPFNAEINEGASELLHVPNYQQTPPEMRPVVPQEQTPLLETPNVSNDTTPSAPIEERATSQEQGRMLPETFVSGAVNVASTAINTARSVINMISPLREPGRWVNGHWVSASPESPREANLQALTEMGFWNRDLNATLLARYNDDLNRVVAELVM